MGIAGPLGLCVADFALSLADFWAVLRPGLEFLARCCFRVVTVIRVAPIPLTIYRERLWLTSDGEQKQADSVRRDLAILLLQAQERASRKARTVWFRRCVDVGCDVR
jgi:hypothetical protein